MRIVLSFVVTAVSALVVVSGLRWFDLVSQEAAVAGFVTGLVVAVVIALPTGGRAAPGSPGEVNKLAPKNRLSTGTSRCRPRGGRRS